VALLYAEEFMLIDMPGAMTAFSKIGNAQIFLAILGKNKIYGIKIKTKTGLDAVLELQGEGKEPRIVQDTLFMNRDVFVPKDALFRFPEIRTHAVEIRKCMLTALRFSQEKARLCVPHTPTDRST
jgi:hypothetical protein